MAVILVGLMFPRVSTVAQTQDSIQNPINLLTTPNIQNITNSLAEINQLEIINEVTKPLNDIIGGFLKGGQDSIIPRLKTSLDGLNSPNTSNTTTMSIGEIMSKSREAFILIAQILVAVLETALWILKSILGFVA